MTEPLLGDPTPHLRTRGRAAVTAVDTETFPLRLSRFLWPEAQPGEPRLLAIAPAEAVRIVAERFSVLRATPAALDLLDDGRAAWLLVDEAALDAGAWLGVSDGSDPALLGRLCVALSRPAALGGLSLLLTSPTPREASRRLRAAADLCLPFADDHPSLSEGAPLPGYLTRLNDLARTRHAH